MRTSQNVLETAGPTAASEGKSASGGKRRRTRDKRGERAIQDTPFRVFIDNAGVMVFSIVVVTTLAYGWLHRDEENLTPEHGLGYWLGICGASLMLMLLLYPLRKRWRRMAHLGSVGGWFRLHMMFGVIGPVLILFHSNFRLGSINSNVALFSMLVVAWSGVIGRYLYSRIHRGLYGHKLEAQELIEDIVHLQLEITERVMLPAPLSAKMRAYAQMAQSRTGALQALIVLLRVHFSVLKRRAIRLQLSRAVREVCAAHRFGVRQTREAIRDFHRAADRYFAAVGRIAAFAFYERMFALWHVLHLPLFVLLVLTAIGHIVAVHLY